MSFKDRHLEMGLVEVLEGTYQYSDKYSQVQYKELETKEDHLSIPALGVFTAKPESEIVNSVTTWRFCGIVSDDYKFTGNEKEINLLRNSIGDALFKESSFVNLPARTQIRCELVISNNNSIRNVGDIYPQVVLENNYNGKKKIKISFGLMIEDGSRSILSFSFKNKLITLSQIHINSSKTRSSEVGSYVQIFNQNVSQLISENYNKRLTEVDIFNTLDLIERIGKRKRESVSAILTEMKSENKNPVTSWELF